MREQGTRSLNEQYDSYERVEDDFEAMIDRSLDPRGPEILYDLVAQMRLRAGADVIDVGCGKGRHSLALAERFDLTVQGIDPVAGQVKRADAALSEAAARTPELRERVRFGIGSADALPAADASIDLVWCRDVLVLVTALDAAFREFRRVLRPRGRVLIYNMFGTDRLEPREAAWLWKAADVVPDNADPVRFERLIADAGLAIDERIELGTDWGEWGQEHGGIPARKLLHAARLLRDPGRYVAAFGERNYEIKLGDCLWHVYRMIGKLSPRVYVLSIGRQPFASSSRLLSTRGAS